MTAGGKYSNFKLNPLVAGKAFLKVDQFCLTLMCVGGLAQLET